MLKLVKNKISKKIVALVLLILTIFSVTQPIFAASGTGSWVGGQFDSGMKTTDYRNSDLGILIRRLYNTKTQEWKTVFCAQHRVDFVTGSA